MGTTRKSNQSAKDKLDRYNAALSSVVRDMYEDRDLSQAEFAAQIGWPQPTISATMKIGGRKWTLELMLAVADWQKMPVEELLAMASGLIAGRDLLLDRKLLGTNPCSDERLTRIIQAAGGRDASDEYKEMWLNADMLKAIVPGVYQRYAAGELADGAIYRALKDAMEAGTGGKNFYLCLKNCNRGEIK